MNKNDVKIKEKSLLHDGFITVKRYILQHKLFAGGWSEPFSRELVIRHHAAAALPYDPILDKIVLLEQFRVGALEDDKNPWLIEIVAGLLEPEKLPRRWCTAKCKEEAGLTTLDILPIFDYWASPGATNEHVSLFIARVDASDAAAYMACRKNMKTSACTWSMQKKPWRACTAVKLKTPFVCWHCYGFSCIGRKSGRSGWPRNSPHHDLPYSNIRLTFIR